MKIGVIGAGKMGAALGRRWIRAGHDVCLSFSRDAEKLANLATSLGQRASLGSVRDAAGFGEVLL